MDIFNKKILVVEWEKKTVSISSLGKTDCNTLNTQFYQVKCHLHVVSQSNIVQNLSCLSIFLSSSLNVLIAFILIFDLTIVKLD